MTHLLAQAAAAPAGVDNHYVLWAILLMAVALILFFLEVLVPSGGVLGFSSAVAMIAGVVLFFKVSTTLGLVSAIVALLAVPFLFAFALKLWPNTPIGKLLTLESTSNGQANGTTQADPGRSLHQLVGQTGQALTDLHPIGRCLIDGQRFDCLAQTGMIQAGSTVKVVTVSGMEIKVRVVDGS